MTQQLSTACMCTKSAWGQRDKDKDYIGSKEGP